MIQPIDKREVADRKPYRLSSDVLEKRRKAKKMREAKRVEMAERVGRANILLETARDGILSDKNRHVDTAKTDVETAKAVNTNNFEQFIGST